MSEQLKFYICNHFKDETDAILNSKNFSDVTASYFPPVCSRIKPVNKSLESLSIFNKADVDKLFCACTSLSKQDKAFLENANIKKLHLTNCFQMFAPEVLINDLVKEGAYIITPGWLKKWKGWVKPWGEKEQTRQIFSETITKLVLLDTGVYSNSNANLKDFSNYINRPFEIIKIGLDFYRFYLENKILKWRLEKKNKITNKLDSNTRNTQSDYAMALDLMGKLPYAKKEEEIAKKIMDIFVMMFAPKKVSYLSIVDNNPVKLWSIPLELENNEEIKRLSKCKKPMELTESGKGFCMTIGKGNQILAIIEADDIAFTKYITKYQNLALAMADVLVLSIRNSRYFERLNKMNKSLKEINSTKDKLFSIIAHDLRSPFNTILGFSELLRENLIDFDVAQSERFIDLINLSAKKTLALLDNLLQWAKSQTGQIKVNLKKIVLSSIISEVIDSSNFGAKIKNIRLNQIQSEDIEIYSDENMIKAVLSNLISNAIKFTKSGGEITVSAILKQNYVEITVSDNGVGMNDETCKKLFDISTNISSLGTEREKGSGLGLVLCKEFVEKLGGNIWVTSELNKGSNFTFTLPLNKEKSN